MAEDPCARCPGDLVRSAEICYHIGASWCREAVAKEGATVTRQTGEVEWTAIKRTSDGRYQAVADEGENGFSTATAATFLESVYTPTFALQG